MDKFGLLGEKLGHSYSPEIHNLLGDYEYKLYEKSKDEAEDFLKSGYLKGMNVTVPYKILAFNTCDKLSQRAKLAGAVNTVVMKDNKLYGYNTDFYGFEYLLNRADVDVSGKKCLVLGSGGASHTVVKVLESLGAGEIIVISRNGEDNYNNLDKHYDAQIIVNATPVGMYPNTEKSPIELYPFKNLIFVADLIYNPKITKFLAQADDLKIKNSNGLSMLVAQAVKASEIFKCVKIDDEKIEEIIKIMEKKI
jgi:shikimate dehydrogenase